MRPALSPARPSPGAANCVLAAYDIANTYIEGYDIVVNRPKTAAYRAPGSPAAAYCVEVALDELAGKLGIDPHRFPADEQRQRRHPPAHRPADAQSRLH